MVLGIVIATTILEVVAFYVYRQATDTVLLNLAIAVYGITAIIVVWGIDALIRRQRRRRFVDPS